VRFYAEVIGFSQLQHFDDDQISTEYSALMSTVVWDGSKIVMPINEPADGLKKSQIQEYIEHYDGPGVQHIAMRTNDIVATVQALRDRGVRFMQVPSTYLATGMVVLNARQPEIIRVDPAAPALVTTQSGVETEMEVLQSPALAEQVIDKLRLLNDPEFNLAIAPDPQGLRCCSSTSIRAHGCVRPSGPCESLASPVSPRRLKTTRRTTRLRPPSTSS
jgi:hypothetical protein